MVTIFSIMYLSAGTCVMLITTSDGTMKLDEATCVAKSPSGVEWYLIFVFSAILVAQLCPNLTSVAGVSLFGAITAFGCYTLFGPLNKQGESQRRILQSI